MRILSNITGFLFLLVLFACSGGNDRRDVDTGKTDIGKVSVQRYGKAIFELDTASLQQELKRIQPQFPVFLNGDLDDPGTLQRMKDFITDPQLIAADRDCHQAFEDLGWLEDELTLAFRHYAYYFPGRDLPAVYTYVSGFDYEFRTQYYNNNLLIALDMFLGEDYPTYQKLGVPLYVIRKFQPAYITRDCMDQVGRSMINYRNQGNDLIDFMINEGKVLWFITAMIPDLREEILFDYSASQLEWVRMNEGMVWAFMIENEVLYSAEPDYRQKFILEAPFTSYFGKDSPPRLGPFIGYRIVDQYMQKNRDVTLDMLMQEYDTREILKGSRYKPE